MDYIKLSHSKIYQKSGIVVKKIGVKTKEIYNEVEQKIKGKIKDKGQVKSDRALLEDELEM